MHGPQQFTDSLGIQQPIIGGAMYPCSNPELVAAVSQSGGIGVVQPISLTYVHGYDFRAGLRYIRSLTAAPIGLNLLVEKSSQKYMEKNQQWLDIAIEEGVRFFVTALGNPSWVVKRLSQVPDSVIYHDVTERKWALKVVDSGISGLICVNNQAGGHAGVLSPQALYDELSDLGLPLICAGGIGGRQEYESALEIGYAGVQLGTRFVATKECSAHADYKQAIVQASAEDIVLTRKLTGVPVSVINTDYMKRRGIQTNAVMRWLLSSAKTKHLVRMIYGLRSIWQLKKSNKQGADYKAYYQAGKSVSSIDAECSVSDVFKQLLG